MKRIITRDAMSSAALYAVAAIGYSGLALLVYWLRINNHSPVSMVRSDFVVFGLPVVMLFIACLVIGRYLDHDKLANWILSGTISASAFPVFLAGCFQFMGNMTRRPEGRHYERVESSFTNLTTIYQSINLPIYQCRESVAGDFRHGFARGFDRLVDVARRVRAR